MYVVRHMSTPPVTAKPNTTIPAAQEILKSQHFRHLPIVDDDDLLVGIVTDRDLRSAYPSSIVADVEREEELECLAKTPVSVIMTPNPVALDCDATLDDALFLFNRHTVGAIPVVSRTGTVIGILSIQDLMKAYNRLFGLGEPGSSMIEVEDDGEPRLLFRIVEAIENKNVPVTRLVRTTADGSGTGKGVVYVRVHTHNIHGVHGFLRAAGLHVRPPPQS